MSIPSDWFSFRPRHGGRCDEWRVGVAAQDGKGSVKLSLAALGCRGVRTKVSRP